MKNATVSSPNLEAKTIAVVTYTTNNVIMNHIKQQCDQRRSNNTHRQD